MKKILTVALSVLFMITLCFSFTSFAAPETAASALALGDTTESTLAADGNADVFSYENEGSKGYVRFVLKSSGSAEEIGGGWLVEILNAEGEVIGTTTAILDAEGELTHRDYFACADVNGAYTVKVSAADQTKAPSAAYSLEAKETYKFAGLFDKFLSFDLSAFEFVQSIQNKFLTTFFVTITTLGDEGIIFIVLALIFLCTKKYRKIGFAMLIALLVMTICNNLILKDIFARPRPYTLFTVNPEKYAFWGGENAKYFFPEFVHRHTSYSFPSGHTSSAFAAAFAILLYNRKIGIPMMFFAALMGLSRLYVEVHYCTDVIAGAIVGCIYALLAAVIINLLYPYFEKLINSLTAKLKKKKA